MQNTCAPPAGFKTCTPAWVACCFLAGSFPAIPVPLLPSCSYFYSAWGFHFLSYLLRKALCGHKAQGLGCVLSLWQMVPAAGSGWGHSSISCSAGRFAREVSRCLWPCSSSWRLRGKVPFEATCLKLKPKGITVTVTTNASSHNSYSFLRFSLAGRSRSRWIDTSSCDFLLSISFHPRFSFSSPVSLQCLFS